MPFIKLLAFFEQEDLIRFRHVITVPISVVIVYRIIKFFSQHDSKLMETLFLHMWFIPAGAVLLCVLIFEGIYQFFKSVLIGMKNDFYGK